MDRHGFLVVVLLHLGLLLLIGYWLTSIREAMTIIYLLSRSVRVTWNLNMAITHRNTTQQHTIRKLLKIMLLWYEFKFVYSSFSSLYK